MLLEEEIKELNQEKTIVDNKLESTKTEVENKQKFQAKQTISDNVEKLDIKCACEVSDMEERLNNENEEELKNASDKLEDLVRPIHDYTEFYDKKRKIRGHVSEGHMTRIRKEGLDIEQLFFMKVTDYS